MKAVLVALLILSVSMILNSMILSSNAMFFSLSIVVSKSGDLASQALTDPPSVYDAKTEIRRLVLEWST